MGSWASVSSSGGAGGSSSSSSSSSSSVVRAAVLMDLRGRCPAPLPAPSAAPRLQSPPRLQSRPHLPTPSPRTCAHAFPTPSVTGAGFLDPLLRQYLAPLCARVPALAEAGGADLDHHKSFVVRHTRPATPCAQGCCNPMHHACSPMCPACSPVCPACDRICPFALPAGRGLAASPGPKPNPNPNQVRYQLGEDEQLSAHYDNAEVGRDTYVGPPHHRATYYGYLPWLPTMATHYGYSLWLLTMATHYGCSY